MNDRTHYFNNIKRIAILSFKDSRKDFIEWAYANKHILRNHILISTARTANLLEGTVNSPVVNLEHGRAGGYQQVKNLLEEDKVDIILLFGYKSASQEREPWFDKLIETAVAHDVITGYNQSTIDTLLEGLAFRSEHNADRSEFAEFLHSQVAKENGGILSISK